MFNLSSHAYVNLLMVSRVMRGREYGRLTPECTFLQKYSAPINLVQDERSGLCYVKHHRIIGD